MKKLFASCLAAVSALALFTGCSTIKTELDPYKVGNALEVATQVGAKASIMKDANARPYFVAAETAVSALINNGYYDGASLRLALDKISVREIRSSEEVKASIESVLALYSVFEGDVVSAKVNSNAYLKLALLGVDKGLKQALAVTQ